MENKNQIKCPKCGHEFPVEEALSHQAEEKIRNEYEEKIAGKEKDFKSKLEAELAKLTTETEQKTRETFEAKLNSLQEENEKRKKENLELRQKEVDLLKKENELKEKETDLQLKMEKELLEKREEIFAEASRKEKEKNELREREMKKQMDDQKKLIEEMKRKAEQGSMQMQGEVQELALEEYLKQQYPIDRITDVAKGVKGADVLQNVINSQLQECGTIIYESKRTKVFSEKWIEKLKDDQREAGAEIAVIITETMPKGMDRFGMLDGLWVCGYGEFSGLSFVLREMLMKTQQVRSANANKSDKMEILYDYLTGTDFQMRIRAIVEGFTTMKADIDREKRAMQKIWKQREKQIEKVVNNTVDMHASITGIAGKAIQSIDLLELEPGDNSLDEEEND